MNKEYYILEGDDKRGPFTFNELIGMDIDIHTEILLPFAEAPVYASELPEFNAYFEAQGIYFPTGDNLAGYGSRIFAFIIDYILISAIVGLIDIRSGLIVLPAEPKFILPYPASMILVGTFSATFLLYNTIFELTKWKGSLGKIMCRLIVVDIDGKRLKVVNALVRNLGVLISLMIYALPFLTVFFNEHRQAWYDKITKSYIVTKGNKF
ncbi:MAG: hypothetical protein JWQ79_1013 [Mucilaginibacter sp.]|jgi:uncharacterized RDD family membrane protein YckC|nr:hypothetical protein [Mucilaginibacter sp.]